ncbi:MAG TPA: NAD(P)-dependent oxidoreductase [Solirubrobacteraceae bacterium]|nr:NAD(P)-dependent oxidoreductase [Solirubrobacteraceae bacterium]
MDTLRIFLAGATGTLGRRLVPLLIERGHHVTGTTRSNPHRLRALGAEPVQVDPFDAAALRAAVVAAEPDVVVHQLTALSGLGMVRNFDKAFAMTNRLRTEGTDNLIAAARAAGAGRLVWQSYAGWPYAREGGPIKSENDELDPEPPADVRKTLAAIRHLEAAVTGAEGMKGIVLRYGGFYGPGTSIDAGGQHVELMRKRRLPVGGDGAGIWSLVHIDDAAAATVAAIEGGAPGIYNVVDDAPAPTSELLPALAVAVGAPPPRRLPGWLVRLMAGPQALSMMTRARGASNAKARRELGWTPRFTWRDVRVPG